MEGYISNSDLHIGLVDKKYSQPIGALIKRFRRPYPTGMEYIRRLDKEYKIIEQKGFVSTFHRVSDLLQLIKNQNIPHFLNL